MEKLSVNFPGWTPENYRFEIATLEWADFTCSVSMTEVPVLNIITSHLQLILSDRAKTRDQNSTNGI